MEFYNGIHLKATMGFYNGVPLTGRLKGTLFQPGSREVAF